MPTGDPTAASIAAPTTNGVAASTVTSAEAQSLYAQQIAEVPEFTSYGPILKSSVKPVALTESETEYVVTAVKHIFQQHIVFQFNVRNTIPDTVLEQVSVIMTPTDETELVEDFILPLPSLASDSEGVVYVSFSADSFASGSFANTLKFTSKELDPATGEPEEDGYADQYEVEQLELGAGDYIIPSYANFASEFDRLRSGASITETYALSALDSLKGRCFLLGILRLIDTYNLRLLDSRLRFAH